MKYERGRNPNSLKNLERGRFKKGESGNPGGRPQKELCITSILREQLGEECPYAPGKTWAEWLARKALELAGENPTYYKELLDRTEGKVTFPFRAEQPPVVHFIIGKGYVDEPDMQLPEGERTLPIEERTGAE